ncbi:hypothetical protein M436DRAFT_44681 [Aureobasidium namibiae CBS 147.97]|uniref:Small ribosomal subunit protein uS5m n=1 Tax=Aureobasidium namibiae CBS 147.97 TaxID=1043004 RepID=A0A074WLC5_9PEZI|nr:uncharacterized protein M436DRAFT_44681 [Aureobasidium namibiae CBS 147.97]KEQ73925.1 hypothetical protein M436DRAFT_44681 [Aureobasidium namibiae CBS 147.97]
MKTTRCLFCRVGSAATPKSQPSSRAFSTTPATQAKGKPAYPNVRAVDLGLVQQRVDAAARTFKPYTPREKQLLALKYTPAQVRAIEAAEASIDPKDVVRQGKIRRDTFALTYIDDLAKIQPLVDKPVRAPTDDIDPGIRMRTEDEQDSLAPEMPKIKSLGMKFESEDDDPHLQRLMQQTGLTKEAIRRIRCKTLVNHRVVNQTRMGKIQSMYYLTIAGNENGMLGIGEGKAGEDEDAIRQAQYAAIRNMKPIPRYENRTIFGEVEAKVGASVVQLSSRPPGFGNRCQHLIYEMARAAGISDLSARCPRSRNPMNIVKATYEALMKQRLPEDVARARGRKLVDVRKVYYQGLTS